MIYKSKKARSNDERRTRVQHSSRAGFFVRVTEFSYVLKQKTRSTTNTKSLKVTGIHREQVFGGNEEKMSIKAKKPALTTNTESRNVTGIHREQVFKNLEKNQV
mgnify:CR=1 FL=1